MESKIAIIGSGWYGCHLASSLSKKGAQVQIYEKNSEIFSEASLNNQNRLHLGFHYPRSYRTRAQSKRGFKLFNLKYPELISKVDLSLYAIANACSLIDFHTYKQIMKSTGLEFEDISDCSPFLLSNIEGIINSKESLINSRKAKHFFENELKGKVKKNCKINKKDCIELSNENDLVIDCTWNKIFPQEELYFEPTIMFKYDNLKNLNFSLTIMDGELCSIYPYDNSSSTLSDVEFTPLGRYQSHQEAYSLINSLTDGFCRELQTKMEEKAIKYFPLFRDYFINATPFFSIKTKTRNNKADDRYTYVKKIDNKIYSVFSGKIDTVFDIESQIISILHDNI